eukprot:CAMPEP_0174234650 /NCGR_PEP_ID=MMETSP0417-20130205/4343_1 /TAXON_ID=242541 /ORGANISM="Mayorella sp, Strain BSH-02190019" /LENGTH=394 /DNA_ID=CAMNT_0015313043 /DNA_START=22 /DNA_END=1203 /DNA_ORIENTATION=-
MSSSGRRQTRGDGSPLLELGTPVRGRRARARAATRTQSEKLDSMLVDGDSSPEDNNENNESVINTPVKRGTQRKAKATSTLSTQSKKNVPANGAQKRGRRSTATTKRVTMSPSVVLPSEDEHDDDDEEEQEQEQEQEEIITEPLSQQPSVQMDAENEEEVCTQPVLLEKEEDELEQEDASPKKKTKVQAASASRRRSRRSRRVSLAVNADDVVAMDDDVDEVGNVPSNTQDVDVADIDAESLAVDEQIEDMSVVDLKVRYQALRDLRQTKVEQMFSELMQRTQAQAEASSRLIEELRRENQRLQAEIRAVQNNGVSTDMDKESKDTIDFYEKITGVRVKHHVDEDGKTSWMECVGAGAKDNAICFEMQFDTDEVEYRPTAVHIPGVDLPEFLEE